MKNSKFIPSVRYINGMRIYFKTKHTVQVTANGVTINIVRWDISARGTYKNIWYPFCEKLCKRNNLRTIWDIMDLAQSYDLTMVTHRSGADSLPKGIKVRPEKYSCLRRNK